MKSSIVTTYSAVNARLMLVFKEVILQLISIYNLKVNWNPSLLIIVMLLLYGLSIPSINAQCHLAQTCNYNELLAERFNPNYSPLEPVTGYSWNDLSNCSSGPGNRMVKVSTYTCYHDTWEQVSDHTGGTYNGMLLVDMLNSSSTLSAGSWAPFYQKTVYVQAGVQYHFSAYATNIRKKTNWFTNFPSPENPEPQIRLSFPFGTHSNSIVLPHDDENGNNANHWEYLSYDQNGGLWIAPTTGYVTFKIEALVKNPSDGGNDFAVDDIVIWTDKPADPGSVTRSFTDCGVIEKVEGPSSLYNFAWYDASGQCLTNVNGTKLLPSPSIEPDVVQKYMGNNREYTFKIKNINGANCLSSNFGTVKVTNGLKELYYEGFKPISGQYVLETVSYPNNSGGTSNWNDHFGCGTVVPGNRMVVTNPGLCNQAGWWSISDHTSIGNSGTTSSGMLVVDMLDGNLTSSRSLAPVWKKTINVQPNTRYYFSAFAKNIRDSDSDNEPEVPSLILRFPGGMQSNYFNLPRNTNNWIFLDQYWDSNNYSGPLEFQIVSLVWSNSIGNDFAIDDISIKTDRWLLPPTVINGGACAAVQPEPITLSVSGGTGTTTHKFLWYDTQFGNPGTGIDRGSSYTFSPTVTTTFYVSSKDDLVGCESLRVPVTATVYPALVADFTAPSLVRAGSSISLSAVPNGTNATYSWTVFNQTTNSQTATHSGINANVTFTAGINQVTLVVNKVMADGTTNCSKSIFKEVNAFFNLCEVTIPVGGAFVGVNRTGRVKYQLNSACLNDRDLYGMDCLGFKPDGIPNVVSASATAFTDQLVKTDPLSTESNPFFKGLGNWRPKATYQYLTSLTPNSDNFQAGTFTLQYPFDWQSQEANNLSEWLPGGQVTSFSPNGDAIEERNPLNVASSVKFGYNYSLPYLSAANSGYESLLFESFENSYSSNAKTFGEDQFELINDELQIVDAAHSGLKSILLKPFNGRKQLTLKPIQITPAITGSDKGIMVKVWAKFDSAPTASLKLEVPGKILDFIQIAQVGDWRLFEARTSIQTLSAATFTPIISFGGFQNVWLDDLRVQPLDAQVTCYVYDSNTHNVLTIFDDQHFGLFYQYNAEGKLIRKIVETERGMQTLQETQYNSPKVNRIP